MWVYKLDLSATQKYWWVNLRLSSHLPTIKHVEFCHDEELLTSLHQMLKTGVSVQFSYSKLLTLGFRERSPNT